MPGITFVDGESVRTDPPEDFRQRFLEMLDAGQGFVFLHHAMSAWPSWPAYADIIGGRFHYTPGELHGKMCRSWRRDSPRSCGRTRR
jgi:uncharacterized protein